MSYNFRQLSRDLNSSSSKRPHLYMTGGHWGTNAWKFLYNVALAKKGKTKDIQKFLKAMGPLLPCDMCREHYTQYLEKVPLPVTHAEMFQWLQDLENDIAKRNHKIQYKPINRYREVQKLGKTAYMVEPPPEIVTAVAVAQPTPVDWQQPTIVTGKASDCPNCQRKPPMSQQHQLLGVGLNNSSFLRQNSGFARRI